MKKVFRTALALLLLLTALWSGGKLVGALREYGRADDSYAGLQQLAEPEESPAPTPPATAEPAAETEPAPTPPATAEPAAETEPAPEPTASAEPAPGSSVDFAALGGVSEDVVGWIRIDGTRIDYPIAQSEDNAYYLDHLLDGSWNGSGTIFLDYRCPDDFSAVHSIIYGHHMQSGSMFAGLMGYKQQAFYDGHPSAFLATPMGDFTVEFFSGYAAETVGEAWEMDLADPEAYEEWVDGALARSLFTSPVRPEPGERILTLATCSYEFEDARFVLHGVIR